MTDAKPDDLPTLAVVYMGQRLLTDGKLGDTFVLLDTLRAAEAGQVEEIASAFEAKRKAAHVVGGVYRVPVKVTDGRITTMRTGSLLFDKQLDDDRLADWEARDAAAKTRLREMQIAKRLKTDRAIDREIAALRALYRRLPYGDKQAFEVWLLHAIRRGK